MIITHTQVDAKSKKELEDALAKIMLSGLSDTEQLAKAKQLIQDFNDNLKDATKRRIAQENKKWLHYQESSWEEAFFIITPDDIPRRNIPHLAQNLAHRARVASNLQFDKIAGDFYKDIYWVFDRYSSDNEYSISDAETDINIAMGRNSNLTKTIINTLRSSVGRIQNVMEAEIAGFEYFYFVHTAPERPFCQIFDKNTLHKEEWEALDDMDVSKMYNLGYKGLGNGQGLPILSSGGGFNCKGDMRPVNKFRR